MDTNDFIKELMGLVDGNNKGVQPLVKWAQQELKTPFAKTENGEMILSLIADLAKASALLSIKVGLMGLEEIALESKARNELQ